MVLSDSGNIYDALFMAARAALWDTKVPRTRSVEYKVRKGGSVVAADSGDMDLDEDTPSGFDTRHITNATDFELPDYWDEGEALDGRDRWPVCITLNLVRRGCKCRRIMQTFKDSQQPPVHYLDAVAQEEASTPLRLLAMFSFSPSGQSYVRGMRMIGPGELNLTQLKDLVKVFCAFLLSPISVNFHARLAKNTQETCLLHLMSS
jgi:exosome complex component RRP42